MEIFEKPRTHKTQFAGSGDDGAPRTQADVATAKQVIASKSPRKDHALQRAHHSPLQG